MIRKTLSAVIATAFLIASFASANATTHHRRHASRHVIHASARHSISRTAAPRDASTDQLNQQSLSSARGAAQ